MRRIAFTFIFLCFTVHGWSQSTAVWKSFFDSKKNLHGFKNEKGNIVIPPKFSSFIIAQQLEHIMVAAEDFGDSSEIYYLTKSGKKMGADSVWMVDNTPDCESEGFILFRNKITGKVGMLNRHGHVAIPAIYDELSQVHNGMVVGLKGATKKNLSHGHDGCDHYTWENGTSFLLDTGNHILITDFKNWRDLSMFKYFTSFQVYTDSTYQSYLGNGNKYYHFLNYETEFHLWLKKFLKDLTKEKLQGSAYRVVKNTTAGKPQKANKYISKNYKTIITQLQLIQKPGADYFTDMDIMDDLNYLEKIEPGKYFNHCGQFQSSKYPIYSVIINNEDKTQLQFSFLRTDTGYKLISVP